MKLGEEERCALLSPRLLAYGGLGEGQGPSGPRPSPQISPYSALERPAPPFVSLIMAWAAAMRAMGMRMGEQET